MDCGNVSEIDWGLVACLAFGFGSPIIATLIFPDPDGPNKGIIMVFGAFLSMIFLGPLVLVWFGIMLIWSFKN